MVKLRAVLTGSQKWTARSRLETSMSRVEQVERQIGELSPKELAAFREWFAEFAPSVWDRQFEADIARRLRLGTLTSILGAVARHEGVTRDGLIGECLTTARSMAGGSFTRCWIQP